jgi:glutathione S-transferase
VAICQRRRTLRVHSRWFLTINPRGQLPVLEDEGVILPDAQAILVYLASRYDPERRWYPREDPVALGRVAMWLGFAPGLTATAGAARLHDTMFQDGDIVKYRTQAHELLRILDEHLWFAEQAGRQWLCGLDHPTIADLACFPDVMLAEEGGIARLAYPAIRRWTDRVRRLPQFIPMPGIFSFPASV